MGVNLARQALRVGGEDPGVLAPAAFVLARFGEDIDAAIALVDRSLVLNPSFARGWACSGYIRILAAEVAGYSRLMGRMRKAPSNASKRCAASSSIRRSQSTTAGS